MSSARPPSGIDSSAFLSTLSPTNRLNGPKESTSLGCELRRSFIRVVRPLMSHPDIRGSVEELPCRSDDLFSFPCERYRQRASMNQPDAQSLSSPLTHLGSA